MIIYNSKGEKRIEFEPDSSSQNEMGVMLCNTITLSFVHFQRAQLEVNDYTIFEGERFTLGDMYQPVHKNSQQYAYEGVTFYGTIGDCRKALVLKMVNNSSESEFSLTASLRDHLELVVANINRAKGGHDWVVGNTAEETKNMTITYSSLFCVDALNKIAEAFETEWWVEGYTINAIKAEFGSELELGYGAGLLDLSRNENKTARFFTRLYPVGGTRNIDKAKYGHERLQLPGGAKYVDRNTELGVVEEAEREAFAHIYPRRIGTVGVVRSEPAKIEGADRLRYFFSDPGLTFDPNEYTMGVEQIMIAFQSGELNGRDFEVGYKDGEFEIKNVYPTPEIQIPGGAFVPKGGDEYILYNIRMPDEYYPIAEEEYKKAVDEYIAKYSEDTAIYRARTDYLYLGEREITISVGRRVRLMSDNFEDGSRSSRVTKITRRLNDPLILNLEISNAISKTRLEIVENAVVDIKATLKEQNSKKELQVLRSWDSTDPSDNNIYSALKSLLTFAKLVGGNMFRGVQMFFDELRSSDYIAGLTGWSIRRLINGRWGMEIGSLVLHDFLEVPELRFNRTDVVSGELWNAIAFGTVESVDVESQIVTVKLLDGELLSSHVGDICRGTFHNLLGTSADEDSNGFLRMKGFATSYFTPTELLPDGKSFRYELQPDTTFHPCKAMKFVCYGSFVDKTRQASAYSTRTYKRYLSGVNTWVIDPNKHIMAQFGDIDGLTIGGVTMKGHGSFQKNIYMTGVHIQFTPEQLEDLRGKDAYNVSLSTYEGIVKLSAEGSVPDMTKDANVVTGDKNVVTGDKNVVTQIYSLTTRIQAFKGDTELFFSVLPTKGAYNVTLSPHGCDAVVSAGVLTVLNITNTDECYVEMSVNCEGNAIFEKRYTIVAVKDGESGEGAYVIDLDNENDSVACDHAGNLLDVENLPTTNIFVYCGSSLDLGWNYTGVFTGCEGVVANVMNDKGVVESGKVTLSAITADRVTVVVTAQKMGVADLKTTFTVSKIKGGADGTPATRWWFTPSVNVIKRSASGVNDPTALRCTISKQVGNNPIESFDVNSAPGFTVFFRFDGGTEYPFPGSNNEIYISSVKKYVDLSLKENKTGQVYDSERICVVQDGGNGYTFVYRKSDTKPPIPTGTAKIPTGWQVSVTDESNGIQSVVNQDAWIKNIDGSYNAPLVVGETFVKNRIEIITTKAVTIDISLAITGSAQNKIVIGNLNTAITASSTQFAYQISSATKKCTLSISSAGKHFIEVGYYRVTVGVNDSAKYKVDSAPSPVGVWWSSSSVVVASTGLSDGIWSDPIPYKGTDVSYVLESATTHITCNSLGSYSPSSFLVTLYGKYTDSTQVEVTAYLAVYGYNGAKWVRIFNPTVKSSCVRVQSSGQYKQYMVKAHSAPDPDFSSVSFASFSVSVMEEVNNSSSGSMPRNCGKYRSDATYVYDKNYQDCVYITENGRSAIYRVKVFGTQLKGVQPGDNDGWEEGNKEIFTAIDTALIDGADIGGLLFKDEKLVSRSGKINGADSNDAHNPLFVPNLMIDGRSGDVKLTGEINATSGRIGGFVLGDDVDNNRQWLTSGKMKLSSHELRFDQQEVGLSMYFGLRPQDDISQYGGMCTIRVTNNVSAGARGYGMLIDCDVNNMGALQVKGTSQFEGLVLLNGAVKTNGHTALTRDCNTSLKGWLRIVNGLIVDNW